MASQDTPTDTPEETGVFGQKEKIEKKELWRAFRDGPAYLPQTSKIFPRSEREEMFEELFPRKESFIPKHRVKKAIKDMAKKDAPMARYLREVTGIEDA